MYKTTLKNMKKLPELTAEIMYNVYSNGGGFIQEAYSSGIYGCTGQVFRDNNGNTYYTTDIYAGLDNAANWMLREYLKKNNLSFADKYGRVYSGQ